MKSRNIEIDLTKGILTIGMILSHVITILGDRQNGTLEGISTLISLISFSGFLFCFGFVSWIAYLQTPKHSWPRVIKTVLKCYLAYYISGIAYSLLVSPGEISSELFVNIAIARELPKYSEFLLSFALTILLGMIFHRVIRLSTNRWQNLLLSTIVCLAFTFLPDNFQFNALSNLLFRSYYPIIIYFPVYLLGIYAARHSNIFNMKLYVISSISACGLLLIILLTNQSLIRHPPSVSWVLCSAGLFFLFRGFAYIIHEAFPLVIKRYLNAVGQNTLFYLVISNLVLFTSIALGLNNLNSFQIFILFALLMGFLFYIQFISIDLNRANKFLRHTN